MPESVKKAVEIKKPTSATAKKPIQKKVITKKPVAAKKETATTAAIETKSTTEDAKPKLTQGQKLLKAMTAQKAAKKALMKGVASTHVSFGDDGEAKVETVIKKTEVEPKKTNKNRPAMKKPEKKRKAEDAEITKDDTAEEVTKQEEVKKSNDNKKPPKRAKKPKKSKIEIAEEKKDSKQEEALAYVRLFVNDRNSWKFKKVQQIWLLSNLYEIPEDEFDNVLEYLKDLQGSAREKTKKEAEEKIPVKKVEAPVISNTLTGYAAVSNGNDDDDFDAEKLLAQATMAAPVATEEVAFEEDSEDEDETLEIKRAKLIINVLG